MNDPERSIGKNLNLPNILSLTRIFLAPLVVVVIITKYSHLLAAFIFSLAILTDWLDGYLARRKAQVTSLGKLLDPFADKLLILSAFISLVEIDLVPAWIVAIIAVRELVISCLRAIAAAKQEIIAASSLGKYKTAFQTAAILLIILHITPWNKISLWIALGLTVFSGVDYLIRFRRIIGLQDGFIN